MVKGGKKTVKRSGQDKGHLAEMQAFAQAIRTDGQPPIPYDQLIGVTRATFMVLESISKNGESLNQMR
jgi:polar amino acid transport system substrate-binding protein